MDAEFCILKRLRKAAGASSRLREAFDSEPADRARAWAPLVVVLACCGELPALRVALAVSCTRVDGKRPGCRFCVALGAPRTAGSGCLRGLIRATGAEGALES